MAQEIRLRRVHFAAGDYLTRYPEGSQHELRIDTATQKAGWIERKYGGPTRPDFPGSAVLFEGLFYEVLEIGEEKELPSRVCYYLRKWDDRFPLRTQFEYSVAECRRTLLSQREETTSQRISRLLWILSPLVGLLPAADQRRLANNYGVSGPQMTIISSVLLVFPFGMATLVYFLPHAAGETLPGPAWLQDYYLLAPLFLAECFARLYSGAKLEEPMGSILIVLPLEAYRSLRRNLDSEYRRSHREVPEISGKKARNLLRAKDEVRKSASGDADLEILSLLPKPDWGPTMGILYEGSWYRCLESSRTGTGETGRWLFRLQKAPEGFVFRTTHHYKPEEVQEIYRQHIRRQRSTWVETFALLWGTLDAPRQKALAELYEYAPLRFTKWSILTLGFVSASNLIVSLLNVSAGVFSALDATLLPVAGYFLLESVFRWRRYRKREASGSLIGVLLRPIADRLIRD